MVKKFEIVDLYSYVYDRVRKEKARRTEVNQGNSNRVNWIIEIILMIIGRHYIQDFLYKRIRKRSNCALILLIRYTLRIPYMKYMDNRCSLILNT